MNTPKIVIVDDDDSVRAIITTIAQETLPGALVVEYFSSLRALQEIETGGVHLLITNCHMPDMDGPTLIKTIRAAKHELPIIMVSGSDEARAMGKDLGIDRFVSKTRIHAELAKAIQALIAGTRVADH